MTHTPYLSHAAAFRMESSHIFSSGKTKLTVEIKCKDFVLTEQSLKLLSTVYQSYHSEVSLVHAYIGFHLIAAPWFFLGALASAPKKNQGAAIRIESNSASVKYTDSRKSYWIYRICHELTVEIKFWRGNNIFKDEFNKI